jgi:DNA modification methylase
MSFARNQLQMFLDIASPKADDSRVGRDIDIDPIDATFRDSARAPLHSWFPYLEGYSPRFVESVRAEYLPNARHIIDPFAGSGTTPIVLGQAGIASAYSEANPAMAFVIQTKLSALRLKSVERRLLSEGMRQLSRHLDSRLKECKPDAKLKASYLTSFGRSVFFDEASLDSVLRLRTLNDEITSDNEILGQCLTLAILAALVPCSLLKRAGDLRFKTAKELALGCPLPTKAVAERLQAQAADLLTAGEIHSEPVFACTTAAELGANLDPVWDGVITSPPYLNGTNYIRNARLELWYLRYVKKQSDLRSLRDKVITSGINDVDAQTSWEPVTEGVRRVVAELQEKAYDGRIAKMVGGYFFDMDAVFRSLSGCTRYGARLCIDIGDSIYAGVHVPTDDLLVEVAENFGFRTIERMHLRKRTSKGGVAVRQQLLVFENRGSESGRRVASEELTKSPTLNSCGTSYPPDQHHG